MNSHQNPYPDILITPVQDGPFFVESMFQRAYGHAAPDFGHALVGFYRKAWDHYVPLCFTLFWPHEEVMLNGGSVTNGAALKLLPPGLSEAIRNSDGLFFHILRFGFEQYADDCEAFFATCGDARAWEVSMKAGFQPTRYEHLIARFHKPMKEAARDELTDRIHALGSF
jgi:hypothetical protein